MQTDDNIVLKANNYLKLEEPYQGETEVLHYLEVLRDKVGFDELKNESGKSAEGQEDRRILRMSSAPSGKDHADG